jgi:hypothetical protein
MHSSLLKYSNNIYMCLYICVFLGHALISLKTEGADPIHKATIMPRGRALCKIHIRHISYNTI